MNAQKVKKKTMLVQEVKEDEIKGALFAMAANKSLGLDGYTCEFYKTAWPIICKEFVAAVQSFFEFGFLTKRCKFYHLGSDPKTWRGEENQRLPSHLMLQCDIQGDLKGGG